MNWRRLVRPTESTDRAVSPVLGVAILVGITIVLGSVIGAFVFGVVSLQDTPDPKLEFVQEEQTFTNGSVRAADRNMTTLDIRHVGGDAVKYGHMRLQITGNRTSGITANETVYDVDYVNDSSNDSWFEPLNTSENGDEEPFETGEEIRIAFYGVPREQIQGKQINNYSATNYHIEFDDGRTTARKLKHGDTVKLVFADGQASTVLRRYEIV
jgi:flagellin-like protein